MSTHMKNSNLILFMMVTLAIQNAFSVEKFAVTLGSNQTEVLTFLKQDIRSRTVFELTYQTPTRKKFGRAIPKEMFASMSLKLNDLDKLLIKRSSLVQMNICTDKIRVQIDKDTHYLCFDSLDANQKKSFYDWFYKSSKIAKGQFESL